MKIALFNSPWYDDSQPLAWGVRAGSRWPHMQERPAPGQLPRYIPFPFFLATAARILQNAGHEVLLVDGVASDLRLETCLDKIQSFGPRLVFCEAATPSLPWDLEVMKKLRQLLPSAVLAAGGSQGVSMVPDIMDQHGLPDFWLGGEYDFAVQQLVDALEGRRPFSKVDGLVGAGVNNRPAVVEDVKSLPSPLYEVLPVRNYSDPVCGLPSPVAQAWLSRGCPYKCTFCVWPQVVFGNSRYRTRDPHQALDDIERLIRDHGCESFYFDDDTANIGPARMIELAAAIKSRGLDKYPWSMMARADCMTEAVLDALHDAGMYSVKYGVESLNETLVDTCEKGTDIKKFHRTIEHTKKLGIKLHLTFMFGIPHETAETVQETLDYAMSVAPDSAQFSLCTPFPGTKFYRQCEENGWLITKDWSRFLGSDEAVVETPWLKAAELTRLYHQARDTWHKYNLERLEAKRAALLRELQNRCPPGSTWEHLGDPDFASFIAERDPELASRQVQEGQGAKLSVIISHHDEEKIYRRLLRADDPRAKSCLKLFG